MLDSAVMAQAQQCVFTRLVGEVAVGALADTIRDSSGSVLDVRVRQLEHQSHGPSSSRDISVESAATRASSLFGHRGKPWYFFGQGMGSCLSAEKCMSLQCGVVSHSANRGHQMSLGTGFAVGRACTTRVEQFSRRWFSAGSDVDLGLSSRTNRKEGSIVVALTM